MKKSLILIFTHAVVFGAGFLSYSILRKGNDAQAQAQATRQMGFVTLGQSRQVVAETKQAVRADQKELAVLKLDLLLQVIDQTMEAFGRISPLNEIEQQFMKEVRILPSVANVVEESAADDTARRRVVLPP